MDREMAFMKALQDTAQFEMGENSLRLIGAGDVRLAELVASD
jgi:heat shock protein HslJ